MTSSLSRRAGPVFGAVLVAGGLLAAFTPSVPTARALDPTPDPGPSQVASPTATTSAALVPVASADPSPAPATSAPATPVPSATPGTSPQPTSDPAATPDPGASATPDPGPSATASATPAPATPAPSLAAVPTVLRVAHGWVDTWDDAKGRVGERGAVDEPLAGAARFTVYLVRFQVVNDGATAVTLRPALQASVDGTWTPVPEADPVVGQPFYAATDDGRRFRSRHEAIPATSLRLPGPNGSTAIAGRRSAGVNPLPEIHLGADTHTEVEFAVRATTDAAWRTDYQLRLVSRDAPMTGMASVTIRMSAKPTVDLSPGQKVGRPVAGPLPLYALDPSAALADMPNQRTTGTASTVAYALRGPFAAPSPFVSPHTNYSLTTDACAACHSGHTAPATMLRRGPTPMAAACFTCHDGAGSIYDTKAEWAGTPANDPATSSWYSHPATSASAEAHVSDREDEFGGVSNRHAACADCHQPHRADGTRPVSTVAGWTAPGALIGASGVSVVNGAAGTAPAYTLNPTTELEYQLCLKCHSGWTELPAQDAAHPSRWALDKGIELNPENVSYHPVEAAGQNQTNAMKLNLAGSSPYKLWAFKTDQTVRCTHCHGDSSLATPASPPAADARLDNHAGPTRGILLANYQDRTLNAQGQLYNAEDFALCYVCHTEEPMVDDSGDVRRDSNFNFHGYHTSAITNNGSGGLDIDVAGAGQGNAVCAECHFRIHSTSFPVSGQPSWKGLVNFAPNVRPVNGSITFRQATDSQLGSCTLTCHGRTHWSFAYAKPPEP